MRYTKKANGADNLVILPGLLKDEIGPGERAAGLIVARGVVRDDDDGRRDHQSLDVSEDFDAEAMTGSVTEGLAEPMACQGVARRSIDVES